LITECVDVGHHIVTESPLVSRSNLEIGVVQVRAHLCDGLLRDIEPQLTLCFRQRKPESPPEAYTVALTPEYLHGRRRITRPQRRPPALIAHRNIRSVKVTCPSRST
jgi:hypothetical protein